MTQKLNLRTKISRFKLGTFTDGLRTKREQKIRESMGNTTYELPLERVFMTQGRIRGGY